MTLMTSSVLEKNIDEKTSGTKHLRTSYGIIPTAYYRPFSTIDLRFYIAYVGRYYQYSSFAQQQFGQANVYTNDFRIGFIAPLRLL